MVLDLQDVDATLEDAVARSQIRLFGSSSRPLAVQAEAGPSTLRSSESSDDSGSEEDEAPQIVANIGTSSCEIRRLPATIAVSKAGIEASESGAPLQLVVVIK